jgi:serine/threonine protein kinase
MLTGRQLFQGDTAADILASVLAREPDLSALPPALNPRLVDLLRRCLDKQPKRRWQAAGDLRAEIETVASAPLATPATAASPIARRRSVAALAAVVAILTAAMTSAAWWYAWPVLPPSQNIHFRFRCQTTCSRGPPRVRRLPCRRRARSSMRRTSCT